VKITAQENFLPKGRIVLRGYRAGAIKAVRPLAATLRQCQRDLRYAEERHRERILHSITDLKRRIDVVLETYALGLETATHNLIMTGSLTGRDLLVQYLIGGTTYSGGINYGALGTGSTAPASSDTQLTSESARATPSTALDVSNNEAEFQFYFPDANLTNGTYHEAGTFMNGTATANSGKMFNHALLGTPYTKASGVDTTLQVNISM